MDGTNRCRPAALRAQLLLGVAGAMAATSTTALGEQMPAPAPDKWVPYTDIGGSVGSGMTAGKADAFVPIWQNMDSLLFGNLGIGTETRTNQFENFGLGYRTKINPDWILGGYAGFDSTQLQDNNSFNQAALGAELMSAEWDIRLNGYIAGNEAKNHPGASSLYINGTTIAVMDAQDAGYTGFDGEVGYRVFSTDNTDVRVFLGGFMFGHVDSNQTSLGESFDIPYRNIAGPRARAELTVYDFDILGPQSRLTLDGEVAHDDVRGTTGFFGATLRIPLGDFGGGAQALDELDRRMVDPERRNDTVLTRASFTKPEPVIIYGPHVTSQPTNTLLYVDNTQGIGTYANPTTFADAAARNTTNAFIVITSKQGPVSTAGVTLQPGQTVVPGGQTFTVEGEFSHAKFSHDFDAATDVKLVGTNPAADVITLSSNDTVYDVDITGTFANAIYGKNVQNVSINDVTINGAKGGQNGIDIVRTVSGSQSVSISNTTVSNVSGTGIRFDTNVTDGGFTSESTSLLNVTVANTGGDGIHIDTYAGNGSQVSSALSLSNATIRNAGGDGVYISSHVDGLSSRITQTLALSNVSVAHAGEDGIYIGTSVTDGGYIRSAYGTMSGLTISDAGRDGIDLFATASGAGSHMYEGMAVSNATVTNPGVDGFHVYEVAHSGGLIGATTTLSYVTVRNAGHNGLAFNASSYGYESSVNQRVHVSNATITNSAVNGVFVLDYAAQQGQLPAYISLKDVTVNGTGHDGFDIRAFDEGPGSFVYQTVVADSDKIANAGTYGVVLVTYAGGGGGNATNNTTLNYITINGSHYDGITAYVGSFTGRYATQTLHVSNIDISNSGNDGISVAADGFYSGRVTSNFSLADATIAQSGGTGVEVFTDAYGAGSIVTQTASVSGVKVSASAEFGVVAVADAAGGGYAHQEFSIANATISDPGKYAEGLGIQAESYRPGAYVYQAATAANVSITSPVGQTSNNGIDIRASASLDAIAVQNVAVSAASVNNSLVDLTIGAGAGEERGTTTVKQTVSVSDSSFTNGSYAGAVISAGAGVIAGTYAVQTAAYQSVTITNTKFANSGIGIKFAEYSDNGASATERVALYGVEIAHSATYGISALTYARTGGLTNQNFVLSNVSITDSGADGIDLSRKALTTGQIVANDSLTNVTVTGSGGSGIVEEAYSSSSYSMATETISLSNVDVSRSGLSGIEFLGYSRGPSTPHEYAPYTAQYVTIANSTISNVGSNAFNSYGLLFKAETNGQFLYVRQESVITDLTVSDVTAQNQSVGIGVEAQAVGGWIVNQNVSIDSSSVARAGTGFQMNTAAYDDGTGIAIVSQTAHLDGDVLSNNSSRGISIATRGASILAGYHSQASAEQNVYVTDTKIDNNGIGFSVVDYARNGADLTQFLELFGVEIARNLGDGFYMSATAQSVGFADQHVRFSGDASYIAHNGGDGVNVETLAGSGGGIIQGIYAKYVHIDGNANNGVFVNNTVSGYYSGHPAYRSQLEQYVIPGTGSISKNGGDGLLIINAVNYSGQADQFVAIRSEKINSNGADGVQIASTVGGQATIPAYLHSGVEIYDSTISHNAGSGIVVSSTLDSQYPPAGDENPSLSQYINVVRTKATHNGGSGFVGLDYGVGVSSLNTQSIELNASHFSGNGADGAYFRAQQTFGTGDQHISIEGGVFNKNARDGLDASAYATGDHSQVGQYISVTSYGATESHFNRNGESGIDVYAEAKNGVYVSGLPCSVAQGASGGCAVVRHSFDMAGGTANANREDGMSASSYAGNFGAVYGANGRPASPTISLSGVQFNGNVYGSGLFSYATARNSSYVFSSLSVVDSTFNNNRLNGLNAGAYATQGSTIVAHNALYSYKTGTAASGNGGFGVALATRATVDSAVDTQNKLSGVTANHNGYDGVAVIASYNDETSRARQTNIFQGNTISYNGHDGIELQAIGNGIGQFGGGYQRSTFTGNTVASNGRYGLYGLSATGAAQYVNVNAGGNTFTGNVVADRYFKNLGGFQDVY